MNFRGETLPPKFRFSVFRVVFVGYMKLFHAWPLPGARHARPTTSATRRETATRCRELRDICSYCVFSWVAHLLHRGCPPTHPPKKQKSPPKILLKPTNESTDFFVTYERQRSIRILQGGTKYSTRDLIRDVVNNTVLDAEI